MKDGSILREDDRIYTVCGEETGSVHGEDIISRGERHYREWIPWRSKLAALLKKRPDIDFPDGDILYLGAAQGTTVSHLSDTVEGTIYAVEFSQTAFRKLSSLSRKRDNIIPILEDAFHPERYSTIVPTVDVVYQDVSQKDQVGMAYLNTRSFLKKDGSLFLMLKARSVDVTQAPEKVFIRAEDELSLKGIRVTDIVDLSPFQTDHAAMIATLSSGSI